MFHFIYTNATDILGTIGLKVKKKTLKAKIVVLGVKIQRKKYAFGGKDPFLKKFTFLFTSPPVLKDKLTNCNYLLLFFCSCSF